MIAPQHKHLAERIDDGVKTVGLWIGGALLVAWWGFWLLVGGLLLWKLVAFAFT